ncbi:MAG: 5-formyltetrahydrofolate cyclo-ligase [Pseudomonadales bacterium]
MPSLRQQLRSTRRSLGQDKQISAALALARRLSTDLKIIRGKRFGFYLPNDGEIDPGAFMDLCQQMNKEIYLPVVPEGRLPLQTSLLFQSFNPGTSQLFDNRFGIPEPSFNIRDCIQPKMLDVVFMPLVGFDRDGNRLGMGGGYYDQTFSARANAFHRPLLIGLAHSIQETTLIPDPWDIPMDIVFTENERIETSRLRR